MVNGWIPNPQIEIGYGSLYNPNLLGNERVLELAANSNSCVKQMVKFLEVGLYQLGFEYAARFGRPLADSHLEVSWNGNILKKFTPSDYKVNSETLSIDINFEGRINEVKFCAAGGSQKNLYGPILKSVSLVKKSGNLIINSNFKENECTKDYCVSTSKYMVKGWIPDLEIEIGYGNIYNFNLENQRVIELAVTSNSCVKQIVKILEAGIYQLGTEYVSRSQRNFDDCEFQVFWNGKMLKRIIPYDYKISSDLLKITINSPNQDHELKFCSVSEKENNEYGAVLKSVNLIKLADLLPSTQPTHVRNQINDEGIYLDSHSKQCFRKEYFFQGGKIEINFNYNLITNRDIKDSTLFITFDGQPVYRVLPNRRGQTIKIIGETPRGYHQLGFCPFGSSNESPHQVVISNVNIFPRSP